MFPQKNLEEETGMNDPIEKMMELADALAQEAKDFGHLDQSPARQALQDELMRLFPPLTNKQIKAISKSLGVGVLSWTVITHAVEKEHGITKKAKL